MVETNRPSNVPDEGVAGFELSDAVWRLDLDYYHECLESIARTSPTEPLSASDCYRIGNRLEAFLDESQRAGEGTAELVEQYPELNSRKQVYWLARFFRQCHEHRLQAL